MYIDEVFFLQGFAVLYFYLAEQLEKRQFAYAFR